jgi:hypothetical protein
MQTIYHDSNVEGRRSGSDRRADVNFNYKDLEKRVSGERRKKTRKRKKPRFQVQEVAYALIKNKHGTIGTINDVSMDGLAFQYLANGNQLNGLLTIDIFRNSKDFYLKNVSFEPVSDFYLDSKLPFSTIFIRRCGGKFVDLTGDQVSQLDRFIRDYTTGEA